MRNKLFSDPDKLANSLFERSFTATEKTIKRTFGVIVVLWIVGALCSLTLMGGVIWVAFHFISKYW